LPAAMKDDHEKYMRLAIEQAHIARQEGEQPFGAVVVQNGRVIARAYSQKVGTFDVTAHAETLAVGLASRTLRKRELSECVFYSVCEPCPMCMGAIINAHFSTLVLGARIQALLPSLGKAAFSPNYNAENMIRMTGSPLLLVTEVLEEECASLYQVLQTGQTSR